MKYLLEPGSYLIDKEELNKFSRNQTPLNLLLDYLKPLSSRENIEILYPEKHVHSEFQTLDFLNEGHKTTLEGQEQIINRLKPLHRKIKNLNNQEKYLLQILEFYHSTKNILIIDQLSFLHESNLKVLKNLIETTSNKTLFIIDRKEMLWRKDFHCFELYSLQTRYTEKLAS